MEAIIQAANRGEIPVSVKVVISDKPDAPALEKAKEMGVAAFSFAYRKEDRDAFYARILRRLDEHDVEVVALAGYMRILPESVVNAYPNRILNIHPSLLPAFPGLHPHRQAIEHGAKLSGCTVHLVDSGVDSGPILLQEAVPVREDDTEETLAARILRIEHRLYPKALGLMASGRLSLLGRRVVGMEDTND